MCPRNSRNSSRTMCSSRVKLACGRSLGRFVLILVGAFLAGCAMQGSPCVRAHKSETRVRVSDAWLPSGPFADVEIRTAFDLEVVLDPILGVSVGPKDYALWVTLFKGGVLAEGATTRTSQRGSCAFVWSKDLNIEHRTWSFEYVVAEDIDIEAIASLSENLKSVIKTGVISQASPENDILYAVRLRAAAEISRRCPSHQFEAIFFLGGLFPAERLPPADAKRYLLEIFPSQPEGNWNWAVVSLDRLESVFGRIPGGKPVHELTIPASEYVAAFFEEY